MNVKMTVVLIALAATSGVALAQSNGTSSTPRIDQRQANQQKRIDEGVRSGALTNREAARLQRGQERVARMENRAIADGKVTAKERRRIEHVQDQQSRKIYREKHDRQHR
jgi:CRISPR/Cas system CSM-associated protein Csm2 small subunit